MVLSYLSPILALLTHPPQPPTYCHVFPSHHPSPLLPLSTFSRLNFHGKSCSKINFFFVGELLHATWKSYLTFGTFLWRSKFSFFLFCLLQFVLETLLGFRKKEKKLWPWLQQKKKNEKGNMLNLLFPLLSKKRGRNN